MSASAQVEELTNTHGLSVSGLVRRIVLGRRLPQAVPRVNLEAWAKLGPSARLYWESNLAFFAPKHADLEKVLADFRISEETLDAIDELIRARSMSPVRPADV